MAMMNLSNLRKAPGSTKRKRRVGRGSGSGMGNQSGKGAKGQLSRSGRTHPYAGFEGGQMRLARLLPKRGFTPPNRVEYQVVNLEALNSIFEADAVVDLEKLAQAGLIKTTAGLVKILATGEMEKPMTVKAHKFSAAAKQEIERAGGKAEVI